MLYRLILHVVSVVCAMFCKVYDLLFVLSSIAGSPTYTRQCTGYLYGFKSNNSLCIDNKLSYWHSLFNGLTDFECNRKFLQCPLSQC